MFSLQKLMGFDDVGVANVGRQIVLVQNHICAHHLLAHKLASTEATSGQIS